MYIPKYSEITDQNLILEVMNRYNFAIAITSGDGKIVANHYPYLIETGAQSTVLLTHLARSNPQYKTIKNDGKCLVIFQGPHQYISPTYYKSPLNVPTWNYVSIHAYCEVETLEKPDEIEALVAKTVKHFETK